MKKQFFAGIVGLLLPTLAAAANPVPAPDLDQKDGITFRFTGAEAGRLKTFLKARIPSAKDNGLVYYGNKENLACSDMDDCLLYLSKREWQAGRKADDPTLRFVFTLPLPQTALHGELEVAAPETAANHAIQLRLVDVRTQQVYAFQKAASCPITEWTTEYLKGNGDCRLEFAGDKKYLNYAPSIQYVRNSDSNVAVVKGVFAGKLFKAGGAYEVDPDEHTRARVTVAPDFYCWDLDLTGETTDLNDRYICQTKLLPTGAGDGVFVSQSGTGSATVGNLILRPRYAQDLVQGFDLSHKIGQNETVVDYCPYDRNTARPGQCAFILNYRRDVVYYPIWKPIQGVAVGWGVAPK